jgi:glucose-6-phosphate-specific signal transduction histidine kinase
MNKKINWKTLSIALVVIIVLFFAIVVIDSCWTSESIWKAPILALIGAIQTTALAIAIWDFVAKKRVRPRNIELSAYL